jgi:hypothetical protein
MTCHNGRDVKGEKGIEEKVRRKGKWCRRILTSRVERVDLPQPLVPQRRTVTDSFRSRILRQDEGL